MLVTLTRERKERPVDLVDMLLECHARIRRFLALARDTGTAVGVCDDEIIDACHRVERYFIDALPHHIKDEEESIMPRLRGCAANVDFALQVMEAQHTSHESLQVALLSATAAVCRDPRDSSKRRVLTSAAVALEHAFEDHLSLEEMIIFPAIRRHLPSDVQTTIIAELRQRRGRRS